MYEIVFTTSGFDQSADLRNVPLKGEGMFPFITWFWDWTIEDEQCQRVGGGYTAVKLRFLLFL
jgi:hypothetical protein